jgi:hypothetical protein
MPRLAVALLAAIVSLTGAGCTHSRAPVAYADYEDDLPIRVSSLQGERLGRLAAGQDGAVWWSCADLARGAIEILIVDARALGANAIGDMRWFPHKPKRTTDHPTCRRRFGWVLIWPMLATPAFSSSRVEAVAYRVPDGTAAAAGLYSIPDSAHGRAQLVEGILADMVRDAPSL